MVFGFYSCTKETETKNDDLKELSEYSFFELQKGDSLPKGMCRDKPYDNNNTEILFNTETGFGLKGTGFASNPNGYPLVGMDIHSSKKSSVPTGYIPIDLNEGAGGKYIYLTCYFKSPTSSTHFDYITEIDVEVTNVYRSIRIQDGYFYPTYSNSNIPADLNDGAGGKYIYLKLTSHMLKPVPELDPIKQLLVVSTNDPNYKVNNWIKVPKDLNATVGGRYIFIFYKR